MPKKWSEPNQDDPLSEPTFNRRMWAAYLRAGYSRMTWAKAVATSYGNALDWDKGIRTPELGTAARMSELVGYTLDELIYGHAGSAARRAAELTLTERELAGVLDAVKASDELCQAWGEFRLSPAGVAQRVTRTYVMSWLQAYESARGASQSMKDARATAIRAAANARAIVDAHAAKLKPLKQAEDGPRTRKIRRSKHALPTTRPTEA